MRLTPVLTCRWRCPSLRVSYIAGFFFLNTNNSTHNALGWLMTLAAFAKKYNNRLQWKFHNLINASLAFHTTNWLSIKPRNTCSKIKPNNMPLNAMSTLLLKTIRTHGSKRRVVKTPSLFVCCFFQNHNS